MPTHFERLGLPARFALDPEALERSYLERSRALHEDRVQYQQWAYLKAKSW